MDRVIEEFHKVTDIPNFQAQVEHKEFLKTEDYVDVLQMNITRRCNLVCKHCHVDAGPHRDEAMTRETIDACMTFAREQKVSTIDITGGAPEMCPDFEYLVDEACRICDHVIVRTNLTIMLNEGYTHLPEFYANHKVEIVCSLPHYRAKDVDRVRGAGTFGQCIEVIQHLNELGYGRNPELVLNMAYNPAGAFFPPDQASMEAEYKVRLKADFDIDFNNLYTLYNNPLGRFGAFLIRTNNLKGYLKKLYDAYNEDTVQGMMCRTQISVDNDGTVYDCDFNLAAGLQLIKPKTIHDLLGKPYEVRAIRVDKHCYACTAGAGSS